MIDAFGQSDEGATSVEVVDTTAPTLALSVSPAVLWPPNHKLVPITVTVVASDVCDPNPTLRLVSITSNEGDSRQRLRPHLAGHSGRGLRHRRPPIPAARRAQRRRHRAHLHDHLRSGRRDRQRDAAPGDGRGAEESVVRVSSKERSTTDYADSTDDNRRNLDGTENQRSGSCFSVIREIRVIRGCLQNRLGKARREQRADQLSSAPRTRSIASSQARVGHRQRDAEEAFAVLAVAACRGRRRRAPSRTAGRRTRRLLMPFGVGTQR